MDIVREKNPEESMVWLLVLESLARSTKVADFI